MSGANIGGPWIDRNGVNPTMHQRKSGEPMPSVVGSRKRIRLSKHGTYDAALAAKYAEKRFSLDKLQIKKRLGGKQFDLMARIPVSQNINPDSVESE